MKPPYRNDLLPGCSNEAETWEQFLSASLTFAVSAAKVRLAALVVLKLYVGHNRFVGDP